MSELFLFLSQWLLGYLVVCQVSWGSGPRSVDCRGEWEGFMDSDLFCRPKVVRKEGRSMQQICSHSSSTMVKTRWKHHVWIICLHSNRYCDLVQIQSAFLHLWAIAGKPHLSPGIATKRFHKHLLTLPDNHLLEVYVCVRERERGF